MIPFDYVAFVEVNSLSVPIPGTGYGAVQREWDLLAGSYALQAYAPAIAPWRRSRLEGDGAYGEVEDEIVVTVVGGTAVACVQAYDALFQILDQAAQWWRGEAVNAVQIRMSVRGGTAGDLAAAVLGPAPGAAPGGVSPAWDDGVCAFVIRDVTIRFGRRGALLAAITETASAVVVTGEVATLTWTESSLNLSPVEVRVQPAAASTNTNTGAAGFLIAARADAPGNIQVINPTAYIGAAPGGITTDAAATARGGSVVRYTPPGTGVVSLSYAVGLPGTTRRAHAFAQLQIDATAGTNQFSAGLQLVNFSSGVNFGATTPVLIPETTPAGKVTWLYLGQVDNPGEVWPNLIVRLQSTAAARYVRLGAIVLVGDVGEETAILAVNGTSYGFARTIITAAHRLLTDPTPQAVARNTGAPNNVYAAPTTFGDRVFQQRGTALEVIALFAGSLDGADTTTDWRPYNGGSPMNVTITGLRSLAYRVPQ